MLSFIKWLFTPKSARPAYVLDWFNKNVAVHPKIYPLMGKIKVEPAQDELRFTVLSLGKYSEEQLQKVYCSTVRRMYTSEMNCPNAQLVDTWIDSITFAVKDVEAGVKSLDKYYSRLFDNTNFNLTEFDYRSSTFDKVSLCPAGVLPLMDATERDIRAQGRYKDELALKADMEKYYNYIIRKFAKRLKGTTPLAREPYMDVNTFEEWRLNQDRIEKIEAEEEMLSKTCKKVLDDIRGYKNMGGAASCAAS